LEQQLTGAENRCLMLLRNARGSSENETAIWRTFCLRGSAQNPVRS
jgi:hypothetical protein